LIFIQAYICFALGELFWILHLYIKQFEQLGTFSISDLSWVGFFAFFLTAYRDIFKKKPQLKKKSVFSVLLTVLVPITLTAGFLFLFMTGDGIVYTIIYLALSILLGYYSVRQILLKDSFKLIHIYILALIYLDLIVSISINLNSEFSHMLKLVFSICLISVNTIFSICIQKQLQAEKDDEEAEVSEMVGVV